MLFEKINKELGTFYKKDEDINWNDISKYRELSENFIEKFKDYIDWNEISRHQILSEDFIKRNEDYVDWEKLSCNPSLLQPFIDSNWDCVNKKLIQNNKLYHLYQQTRNKG